MFYVIYDGTHIKANANTKKQMKEQVPVAAKHYAKELMKEVNEDRAAHGRKPFDDDDTPPSTGGKKRDNTSKKKLARRKKEKLRTVTKSVTDPECGLFVKGEHKKQFAYEAHTACDKNAIAILRHYIGSDEEAAAAIASPYVLKRGKMISGHKNHKGNLYPSITFAAPTKLNGKTGNVAVSVLFGDKDRVHSLRVLTPDGKEFILQKTKADSEMGYVPDKAELAAPTESASKNSIPASSEKSNRKIKTSAVGRAEIEAIQSIGRKSVNRFSADDIAATERYAKAYYEQMGAKSPFFRSWFGDWRVNDRTPVAVATKVGSERGVQRNEDTGWNINVSRKVFNETTKHTDSYNKAAQKYLPYINDIVKKAVLLDSFAMGKEKSINSLMMHSLYAVADIGNGVEVLKLYVEEMNNPNTENTGKRAYQLQNVEKYRPAAKSSQKSVSSISAEDDIHTVADLFAVVKSRDNNFKPNTASKVVNEDGTPKVVYHGTDAESIHVFKNESGAYWFSESEDYAEAMAEERGGRNIQSAYLDMKKPYHVLLTEGKFSDPTYEKPYIRYAKEHGYDGVIFETDTDNELVYDKFYVVFDSKQIKSATENVGTFDKSNPDVRFSATGTAAVAALEEQNKELQEQVEQLNREKEKLQKQVESKTLHLSTVGFHRA